MSGPALNLTIRADLLPILGVVVRLLTDDGFRSRVKTTEEAARALIAELGPDLPRKPDGTPWTTEELEATAAGIVAHASAIKTRMGG